jgi:hypothetical protein
MLLIIIAHKESFIFEDYFYLIKSDFRLVYDMFSTIISRALIQQHQQDVETCVSVFTTYTKSTLFPQENVRDRQKE